MRWTEEQYQNYLRGRNARDNNYPAVPPPDLEPAVGDESVAAEETPRLDTPCHIHVRSFRRRLADADGVSAKAAIDGLIHAGILRDDSPKHVKGVSYSQVKIGSKEPEETEIIISWEAA